MRWNSDTIPEFMPSASNGFSINWESVYGFFPIIKELSDVPQNPDYHGEGDVLTHTRMVVEALTSDQRWRKLRDDEQAELWLAALLHDIGKAKTTIEEIDGSLSSPNHSHTGARMAREILYTHHQLQIPFNSRERIFNYIRHHGLPLWLLERDDPRRLALLTSQKIKLHGLYLIAYNDILGRISNDTDKLIYSVELFREFCLEQNCYEKAFTFADPYTRYLFAQGKEIDPCFPAYDDTTNEVIMLSGLPGSGKDTWIHENGKDWPVISLDDIRRAMKISPTDNQGRVIQEAKEQARILLRKKQPFIWNATNISRSIRNPLTDLFMQYKARVKLVYLECPFDELFQRNQEREYALPESAIMKLIKKLEVPEPFETHEVIYNTKH